MFVKDNDEIQALCARLDDLVKLAERGEMGVSSFLSPKEAHYAEKYLLTQNKDFALFGGYFGAERQRIYLFPEYMEDMATKAVNADNSFEDSLLEYGYSSNISVLKITGSGYRKLTHRDFLGSLLGLGILRGVIGDILVLDENGKEAIVFCDEKISVFIEGELTAVGNDKIKITRPKAGTWVMPERRVQPIHDTVASPRLDAVIAALCNLSREKARETVVSGVVEIDFEREERPDRILSAPLTVSVRGIGRFRVNSIADKTRKGRYRLEAEKFI